MKKMKDYRGGTKYHVLGVGKPELMVGVLVYLWFLLYILNPNEGWIFPIIKYGEPLISFVIITLFQDSRYQTEIEKAKK